MVGSVMYIGQHVTWHVTLELSPGAFPAFEQLTAEMVELTRTERGVLIYERFISSDRRTIHVVERYEDSAAAVAHLRVFAEAFDARFGALVKRKSFEVFGEPSDELRMMLGKLGATFMDPVNGFCALP